MSVPLEWSPTEHVAWEKEIEGYGQSSPVVWGDRVYVSSVEGTMKETLRINALDVNTGERAWAYSIPTKNQGENTDYYSRAAPTPVVSESGICVFFENGDVVSLTHDGKQLWHKDLVAEFGPITSRHGLASSVVLTSDRVIVWVQRDQEPYLLCLKQTDGSVVWKEALPSGTTWSSPTIIDMQDGSQHLVLSVGGSGGGGPPRAQQGNSEAGSETPAAPPKPIPGRLMGLDPATGKRLWELEGLTGNSTPTPTRVAAGKILVGASAGREGGPTKEAIATNGLVSITKEGDRWSAQYLWRSERATCGFCSPITHNGFCYFVDRRGRLYCLDAETGKEVYNENLGHPVWATPLGIGSRIYFVGEEGSTTVIAAGPEYQKLASNQLWESAEAPVDENNPRSMLGRTRQYAVVAIPNALFIRRGDRLYCLRP
jgi:outer membrane protein assembly factor BamB